MAHRLRRTKTARLAPSRKKLRRSICCEPLEDRRLLAVVAGPGGCQPGGALEHCEVSSQTGSEMQVQAAPQVESDAIDKVTAADFDFDGSLTTADLDALVAAIANESDDPGFDVNGDGEVSRLDLDEWLTIAAAELLGPGQSFQLGDSDLNGVVDGTDFARWAKHRFTNIAAWTSGDFNADGVVDGLDFILWNHNKRRAFSESTSGPARGPTMDAPLTTAFDQDAVETPQDDSLPTLAAETIPVPDFNGDGELSVADLDMLVAAIAQGKFDPTFDITGDGSLDDVDLRHWLTVAGEVNLGAGASYSMGDANLDGMVNSHDFKVWHTNKFSTANAWSTGDFNADGFVDGQDFILWNANKARVAEPVLPAASTTNRTVDLDQSPEDQRQVLVDAVFQSLQP